MSSAELQPAGFGALHPGAAAALRLLTGDELDAAHLIAEGLLASPHKIQGCWLFDLRVTGTLLAHRPALKEWGYRNPEEYLNERFLARCSGLPVIWWHPDKAPYTLDSDEFGKRVIGAVFYPYIKGNEVWAVCKIYDDGAVKEMVEKQLSTSPMVVLGAGVKIQMDNGENLLIEGAARFPDHLAICDQGVWDKGGEPSGVSVTATNGEAVMAEEAKETEKADAARADAEALDKILKCVDDVSKRLDDACKRMDAMAEERKDRRRKDDDDDDRKDGELEIKHAAEGELKDDRRRKDAEEDKEKEPEEATRLVADRKRKDAEESPLDEPRGDRKRKDDDDDRRRDAARADSLAAENRALKDRLDRLEGVVLRPVAVSDRAKFSSTQARADAVMVQLGERAAAPLVGESTGAYARRILRGLQKYSDKWAKTNVDAIPNDMFSEVEGQVYADAAAYARRPNDLKPGTFREVVKSSPTGHTIIEFVGGPEAHFVKGLSRHNRRRVGNIHVNL